MLTHSHPYKYNPTGVAHPVSNNGAGYTIHQLTGNLAYTNFPGTEPAGRRVRLDVNSNSIGNVQAAPLPLHLPEAYVAEITGTPWVSEDIFIRGYLSGKFLLARCLDGYSLSTNDFVQSDNDQRVVYTTVLAQYFYTVAYDPEAEDPLDSTELTIPGPVIHWPNNYPIMDDFEREGNNDSDLGFMRLSIGFDYPHNIIVPVGIGSDPFLRNQWTLWTSVYPNAAGNSYPIYQHGMYIDQNPYGLPNRPFVRHRYSPHQPMTFGFAQTNYLANQGDTRKWPTMITVSPYHG